MKESAAIIRLDHVGMEWERNKALHDVNLSIDRGDFMAITGPNGGGKTTLLRIILRLLKPSTGSVLYFDAEGNVVEELPVGYLPQKNLVDSRFPVTVREVIASGLAMIPLDKSEKRMRIDEVTELVGLRQLEKQTIGTLSGGQLQRTLLARAIVSKPEVLVLDEPLSYLDKQFEQRIYEIVRQIAETGTTILLVSHEMSTIAAMANRHLIVDGTIHECHSASHLVHYDCEC